MIILTAAQPVLGQWNYNRRLSRAQVDRVIRDLEDATDSFKRVFDTEIDRTRFDKTSIEDRLWNKTKDLERQTDTLRARFDRTDSWWSTRREVQDVLQDARLLNAMIRNYRMTGRMKASWNQVRVRINALARTFDLPPLR